MRDICERRSNRKGISLHLAKAEDGAAILEFALALPILVTLLFGTFEFGRILLIRQTMINAVSSGARHLGRVPDPSCESRCSAGAEEAIVRVRDQILKGTRLPSEAIIVTSNWQPANASVGLRAVVLLDVEWLRIVGKDRSFRLDIAHREPWIAD